MTLDDLFWYVLAAPVLVCIAVDALIAGVVLIALFIVCYVLLKFKDKHDDETAVL